MPGAVVARREQARGPLAGDHTIVAGLRDPTGLGEALVLATHDRRPRDALRVDREVARGG